MRVPILYALTYPDRDSISISERTEFSSVWTIEFPRKWILTVFRCLKLAYSAGKEGGSFPTVLNAANEEAVATFLNHKITFLQIEDIVQQALERHDKVPNPSLDEIKLY